MSKKTNQPIKQITNASDLEGIQPMERVMIEYYTFFNPAEPPTQCAGIYAGSFDINNEKYIVTSKEVLSKEFRETIFLISSLYKVQQDNQSIRYMMHAVSG